MARQWYEVRVRECIIPPKQAEGRWGKGKYVKKTHMYFVEGPREAAHKYKGKGLIMHVRKVSRERLLPKGGILPEIGGFLGFGDQLLKQLNEGGTLLEQVEETKEKRRQRIFGKGLKKLRNSEGG